MPDHRFCGLVAMTYPESKDAAGVPIGEVRPGDVRDLDEPLDLLWEPASDGGAKLPQRRKTAGTPPQAADQDPGTPAGTDDKAGQPGTEEG